MRFAVRAVGLLFFAALVAIVVLADRAHLPRWILRLYDFPGGDKVGHVILMGTLAFFGELSFGGRRFRAGPLRIPLLPAIVFLLVILEELSQGLFASRTLSLLDFLASTLGILLGATAAVALRRMF